jgi:hypothetical protein
MPCGGDAYRQHEVYDRFENRMTVECAHCEHLAPDRPRDGGMHAPLRLAMYGICPGPRIPEWLAVLREAVTR